MPLGPTDEGRRSRGERPLGPTDEGSQSTSISRTKRSPETCFLGWNFPSSPPPQKKGKQRSVPGSLWQACNPAALLLTTWAESEVDLVPWQS